MMNLLDEMEGKTLGDILRGLEPHIDKDRASEIALEITRVFKEKGIDLATSTVVCALYILGQAARIDTEDKKNVIENKGKDPIQIGNPEGSYVTLKPGERVEG